MRITFNLVSILVVIFTFSIQDNANAGVASKDISCRKIRGNWKLYNKRMGIFIGSGGTSEKKDCLSLVDTLKEDVLCAWDGKGYRPYHARTGRSIGEQESPKLNYCTQYVDTVKNGVMCAPNKGFEQYNVYRIIDGKQIGTSGAQKIEYCKQYTAHSSENLVCVNKSPGKFHVYNIQSGDIVGNEENYPGSIDYCAMYIRTEKNGLICHFDGVDGNKNPKYKIFNIYTNEIQSLLGTYTSDISACGKIIPNYEMDEKGKKKRSYSKLYKLKNLMKKDFRPFIKKLSRQIYFYTYFEKSELGVNATEPLPIYSYELSKKLTTWMDSFRKFVPWEAGMLGYGLYGATNPFDSQTYATGDWMLTEVSFPKYTSFLDVRLNKENNDVNTYFHFSQDTKDTMVEICNIEAGKFTDFNFNHKGTDYNYHIIKNELTKNRICNEALVAALKELKISFVTYYWNFPKRELNSDCERSDLVAALMLTKSFNKSNVKFFDGKGNDKYKSEYQRIYQLARLRTAKPVASWPSFKDADAQRIDTAEELKHQFACKDEFTEDAIAW